MRPDEIERIARSQTPEVVGMLVVKARLLELLPRVVGGLPLVLSLAEVAASLGQDGFFVLILPFFLLGLSVEVVGGFTILVERFVEEVHLVVVLLPSQRHAISKRLEL